MVTLTLGLLVVLTIVEQQVRWAVNAAKPAFLKLIRRHAAYCSQMLPDGTQAIEPLQVRVETIRNASVRRDAGVVPSN